MVKVRWSREEIDYLEENYSTVGVEKICSTLNRSRQSVHKKAKRLGLYKIGPRDDWTPEQDEILCQLYPTATKKELKSVFGRTDSAIYHRANRLGLSKDDYDVPLKSWTEEQLQLLIERYETAPAKELVDAIQNKTWAQIQGRASRLGINRDREVAYGHLVGTGHPRYNSIEVVCDVCGKEFTRNVSHVRDNNYCSNKCKGLDQRTAITVVCDNCGTEFLRYLSHARRSTRNFCTYRCVLAFDGPSGIEDILALALTDAGIKYESQYRLASWYIDFALLHTSPKIAIECDGDYWHGHPSQVRNGKLTDDQRRNMARDKDKDAYIAKVPDWIILRFWGSEIRADIDSCIARIQSVIN